MVKLDCGTCFISTTYGNLYAGIAQSLCARLSEDRVIKIHHGGRLNIINMLFAHWTVTKIYVSLFELIRDYLFASVKYKN